MPHALVEIDAPLCPGQLSACHLTKLPDVRVIRVEGNRNCSITIDAAPTNYTVKC